MVARLVGSTEEEADYEFKASLDCTLVWQRDSAGKGAYQQVW